MPSTWDSNSIEGVEVRQCLLDLYPLLSFPKLSIYNDKKTAGNFYYAIFKKMYVLHAFHQSLHIKFMLKFNTRS